MPARIGRAERVRDRNLEAGGMVPGTRYRVVRRLGASAGGLVYQVEHLELGRRFVLVAVELAQTPELVQRTRAEWQALSQLRHPHIVRVTDAGMTARGLAFCVMERLRGETLRERLRRCRNLAVPEALRIARELATALATAHAIGVVHRNVQPEHVFLGSGGVTQLLGFGPAEAEREPAPGSGQCVRARNYLPPEQIRGAPPDRRSDVYGVGLVLFEMVRGRPALGASRRLRRRAAEAGQGASNEGPPQLALVVPGVSHMLSALVERLLADDPGARPSLDQTIRQLSRLELRYQRQLSTTQATAHYVTRPVLADTARGGSEGGVIVPLQSQTLTGIPWTVFDGREGAVVTDDRARLAEPARAEATGDELDRKPEATARPPEPRPAAEPRRRPLRRPGRGLTLRLVLVMGCSLLAGMLVASWARAQVAFLSPSIAAASRPREVSCWIDCSSVSVPSPRTSSCSGWVTSGCRSRWSSRAPVSE